MCVQVHVCVTVCLCALLINMHCHTQARDKHGVGVGAGVSHWLSALAARQLIRERERSVSASVCWCMYHCVCVPVTDSFLDGYTSIRLVMCVGLNRQLHQRHAKRKRGNRTQRGGGGEYIEGEGRG